MADFRQYTGSLLLCTLLTVFGAVKADENAIVQVDFSTTQTTPGQLITLTLTIQYDEGVEVVFDPLQQSWDKFQLLGTRQVAPAWQHQQWITQYILSVEAPVVGRYSFPELRVNFYRDSEQWHVKTVSGLLTVISAFGQDKPQLQAFEPLPIAPQTSSYLYWLSMIATSLGLIGFWIFRTGQKTLLPEMSTSTDELVRTAKETGYLDWEGLRQWLLIHSGSDPLGKLTTAEPLLHDYQRLRFDANSDSDGFIKLCHQCQERWP